MKFEEYSFLITYISCILSLSHILIFVRVFFSDGGEAHIRGSPKSFQVMYCSPKYSLLMAEKSLYNAPAKWHGLWVL